MAKIGSYHEGERQENLSEEHFSFSQAAARVDADSHTDPALSASIAERDSANTENIRPNGNVTVADGPYDGAVTDITSAATQASGVGAEVAGTATPKFSRTVSTVEVSTDGGTTFANATGTTDWTYSVSGLAAGTYNVVARAIDSAGVTGPEDTQTLTLT